MTTYLSVTVRDVSGVREEEGVSVHQFVRPVSLEAKTMSLTTTRYDTLG